MSVCSTDESINKYFLICCIFSLELILPHIFYFTGHIYVNVTIIKNITMSDNYFDSNYLVFGFWTRLFEISIVVAVVSYIILSIYTIYKYFKHNNILSKYLIFFYV